MSNLQFFKQAVAQLIGTIPTPWRIEVVEHTGSTNSDLISRLQSGDCPDYTVLIALAQTSGRGRLSRSWSTPQESCLAISMAVPLRGNPADWGLIPLAAGVGVVYAFDTFGVHCQLKWPNDVLIDQRKVAGILVEATTSTAVIGVGINVTQTEAELEYPTAISLAIAKSTIRRPQVAAAVLVAMNQVLDWLDTPSGWADLIEVYRDRSATIGRKVRVYRSERDWFEGQALDVTSDGRLLVNIDSQPTAIASGDVFHLR